MNKKNICLIIFISIVAFGLGISHPVRAAFDYPSCCITNGTTCTTMNSKADYDKCVDNGGDTQNMTCNKWSVCSSLSGTASGSADATTNKTSGTLSGTASGSAETTTNKTDGTASTASSTGGIVPCGKSGGSPCTICHLIKGIQNLVNWGKNILVTVAIVGIVIAGLIYMMSSGSETMITTAKNCFKASLVGFAITIAAWLIVNTMLFWILGASSNLGGAGTWYSFSCDTSSSATTSSGTSSSTAATSAATAATNAADCKKYCEGGGSDSSIGYDSCYSTCMTAKTASSSTATGTGLSQSEAKSQLDSCGVTYKDEATLSNVKDTTVQELCNMKKTSSCTTQISPNGGTTGEHSTGKSTYTHNNGYKFDFYNNSCLDNYINADSKDSEGNSRFSYRGTRSDDGAKLYQSNSSGACYARETLSSGTILWDLSTASCPK